ncbi:MAG: ORF6N domain-containing protein [Candidatus Peregrinibacteria bacterium]
MNELMIPIERIGNMIYVVRGHRIMLDAHLATLYGVPTGRLNEQLSRNKDRFPEDFAFQLNKDEWNSLRCQIGTLDVNFALNLKSQIAISSWGGRRKLPWVFTEHGVVMLANILHSKHAIKMSIEVVRAFVHMRKTLAFNEKFTKELQELRSFVLKRFHKTDQEFYKLWKAIEKLINPPINPNRIGFRLD